MITQEYLKSILCYDKNLGLFFWVNKKGRVKAGSVAGYINSLGYNYIQIDGKMHCAHRLAWLYVYGYLPNDEIDHINGNASDNRIANLREANRAQNTHNERLSITNKSGVKGVCWDKSRSKWMATCSANGKQYHLGRFDKIEDAEKIVMDFRMKAHGDFHNHG